MSRRQCTHFARLSMLLTAALVLTGASAALGAGGYWAPYTMGGTSLTQASATGRDGVQVRRDLRRLVTVGGRTQAQRLRGLLEPSEQVEVAIRFRLAQDAKDVVISDSPPAGCEVRFTPVSAGLSADLVELFQWLRMQPVDDEGMLKELGLSASDGEVRFEMPEVKAGRYEVSYLLTPSDEAARTFGAATVSGAAAGQRISGRAGDRQELPVGESVRVEIGSGTPPAQERLEPSGELPEGSVRGWVMVTNPTDEAVIGRLTTSLVGPDGARKRAGRESIKLDAGSSQVNDLILPGGAETVGHVVEYGGGVGEGFTQELVVEALLRRSEGLGWVVFGIPLGPGDRHALFDNAAQ